MYYSVFTTKSLVSIHHRTADPPLLILPFPHLFPLVTPICSLYLRVCLCLVLFVPLFFQIPHMSEIIWYLSFSAWLTLLSIIPSMSIHVKNGKISSFYGWVVFHCVCVYIYVCDIYIYHIFLKKFLLGYSEFTMLY